MLRKIEDQQRDKGTGESSELAIARRSPALQHAHAAEPRGMGGNPKPQTARRPSTANRRGYSRQAPQCENGRIKVEARVALLGDDLDRSSAAKPVQGKILERRQTARLVGIPTP